jgi:hypothetical protein
MSNLFDYSITPASNNSASPNGAPEGMSPSAANDIMRQMMANAAGAFTCYTAGGTASAQTITMSPTLATYSNKVRIAFVPITSTGAFTVNVNGLGAVAVKMPNGTDPPAGAASGFSVIQHNGTNFILQNPIFQKWFDASFSVGGGADVTIADTASLTIGSINIFIGASEKLVIRHARYWVRDDASGTGLRFRVTGATMSTWTSTDNQEDEEISHVLVSGSGAEISAVSIEIYNNTGGSKNVQFESGIWLRFSLEAA